MPEAPALVVFFGGTGDTPVERSVDDARLAAALDGAERFAGCGTSGTVLVTDSPGVSCDAPGVEIDTSDAPFHFGRRLAGVTRRHGLASVIYAGAGALPMLTAAEAEAVIAGRARGAVVTNNSVG